MIYTTVSNNSTDIGNFNISLEDYRPPDADQRQIGNGINEYIPYWEQKWHGVCPGCGRCNYCGKDASPTYPQPIETWC